MGWKLAKHEVKNIKPNEEREIVIFLSPENRAAIHGVVKFPNKRPVSNAVVKLFKKKSCDPCDLEPITFAFTDECGQFLFGVPSCEDFIIKVFFFVPEKKDDCHCDNFDTCQ